MGRREALRRVLTEAAKFDLGRKSAELEAKARQELSKKAEGLANEAAKVLKRAGMNVSSAKGKLGPQGRPKFWFNITDERDSSEVYRAAQQALGPAVKIMPGYKDGEYSIVL